VSKGLRANLYKKGEQAPALRWSKKGDRDVLIIGQSVQYGRAKLQKSSKVDSVILKSRNRCTEEFINERGGARRERRMTREAC